MKKGKRALITLLAAFAAALAVLAGSVLTIASLDLDGFLSDFQAAGQAGASPKTEIGEEGTASSEKEEGKASTAENPKKVASIRDVIKVIDIVLGDGQGSGKTGSAVDDLIEGIREIKEEMIRLSYQDLLRYDEGGFWVDDLSFLDGYDISTGKVVVRIGDSDTDDDDTWYGVIDSTRQAQDAYYVSVSVPDLGALYEKFGISFE